ncbi:hypothetical protein ACJMK2_021382 [Sinanodonta woodiana]|uniref:Uncharacterized protein n=1 Tax=Sinanodonta woodiana TaxID=1069815 RepID=A0ABD3TH19_SINWO
MDIFCFRKHRKRSQDRNDIEHSTPKSVPFPTSPSAAKPSKQNGNKNHEFSTSLYTIEQEIAVSLEKGNGVQMLSESAKEIYQGKDFQVIQTDQRVLTERTNGADKMGSKSIFTKSKQSCNTSVAHKSNGKTMQIKVVETGLESNTGQSILPSTSKGLGQTKPNSLTSCAVEGNAIHISKKRDEVSDTYSRRNHNENLLRTLNPPQNESSRNNVTYDSKARLGTQHRNAHGQPFNYMVVSPDKANDSSNSANKMHVKFTSDHIF